MASGKCLCINGLKKVYKIPKKTQTRSSTGQTYADTYSYPQVIHSRIYSNPHLSTILTITINKSINNKEDKINSNIHYENKNPTRKNK